MLPPLSKKSLNSPGLFIPGTTLVYIFLTQNARRTFPKTLLLEGECRFLTFSSHNVCRILKVIII